MTGKSTLGSTELPVQPVHYTKKNISWEHPSWILQPIHLHSKVIALRTLQWKHLSRMNIWVCHILVELLCITCDWSEITFKVWKILEDIPEQNMGKICVYLNSEICILHWFCSPIMPIFLPFKWNSFFIFFLVSVSNPAGNFFSVHKPMILLYLEKYLPFLSFF